MRSGWKPFSAFTVAVVALIALVYMATRGETQTLSLLAIEIAFVGAMAYLVTFLVWPRRERVEAPAEPEPTPAETKKPRARTAPVPDQRPVVVIGERPAGSRPGAELHVRESPTERTARGRRPGPRPQSEIKWPVSR